MKKLPIVPPVIRPTITPERAKMQADISQYKGKQTTFRMARPVRKVINRYK